MAYTIKINGKAKTADVDADTPLLWVLRDALDMKGAKFGCGIGQCGACTVHLNGQAVRSCQVPVSAVGASEVQAAWMQIDVPQCGYCQAGQIMSATALLTRTPQPTDADIDAAMRGNACRCATYPRIRAAIKTAAGLPTADTRA
jgi:isoquinoline 1-oxidoreductase alpha subunit